MNGLGNCIYEICCPPRSEGAVKALAEEMEKAGMGESLATSERVVHLRSVARWVLTTFDLAPKGSLQQFKDAVRDFAREGYTPPPDKET
jgi:hypothetical protein